MSYGVRITTALLALGLGFASTALAQSSNTVSTSDPGIWDYNINLGNGVSFQMTMDGAFGTPGSNITSYSYIGAPAGYVSDINVTTSGNSTYYYSGNVQVYDGGFDQELVLQYDVADGDYSNTIDYTIAEPTSFWEETGSDLSFTTGDGEYIYDLEGWNGPDSGSTQFDGEVAEGAHYTNYTQGSSSDPACTSCSISSTFTPISATPEPSTFTLFGTGAVALIGVFRRRRRAC